MFKEPIYVIKADAEMDVGGILQGILGKDSIDRIVSIGTTSRVFVVAFWRVPLVNQFHDDYTDAGDTLHGHTLPWVLTQLDPYGIFKDGNFPAPHFLRNSKNLTDAELDELGIGGPGEFVYTQMPTDPGTPDYWEMSRDGVLYKPDMSFYNRPRLEPLAAVNRPRGIPGQPIFSKSFANTHHRAAEFERWRDFYLEYPETWPKDLTSDERAMIEEEYERTCKFDLVSHWKPECGMDPTNMAEKAERLDREKEAADLLPKRMHATRIHQYDEVDKCYVAKPDDDFLGPARLECDKVMSFPKSALTRQVSVQVDTVLKRPVTTWSAYPAETRSYWVDNKYTPARYIWNYRKF